MGLRDDWTYIVRKAWSVRLIVLAAVLSGAEVFFELVPPPQWVPPGAFAAAAGATSLLAFVARVYAQPGYMKGPDDGEQD